MNSILTYDLLAVRTDTYPTNYKDVIEDKKGGCFSYRGFFFMRQHLQQIPILSTFRGYIGIGVDRVYRGHYDTFRKPSDILRNTSFSRGSRLSLFLGYFSKMSLVFLSLFLYPYIDYNALELRSSERGDTFLYYLYPYIYT